MSKEPADVPSPRSPEEPLARRVLRQARKRERDLTKRLDRLAAGMGWYTFVSAQAHAIATGKALLDGTRRSWWCRRSRAERREVERFTPERLEEFEGGHPARAGTSRR